MALVFGGGFSRRDFVKGGLAAFGAVVTFGGSEGLAFGLPGEKVAGVRWAFLSDTHCPEDVGNNFRGQYPYRNLGGIVSEVISAGPDAVGITGDLARLTGQVGDYVNLKKLLGPLSEKSPVFMSMGNHDNRDNFLKVFGDGLPDGRQSVAGKYVVVADRPEVRVIMLDSLFYTNKVSGLLGKAQRTWLKKYLSGDDDTPTILCFHHSLYDGDGDLLDLPRLYEIIAPIRKVKAVVYGHSHVYGFSEYEGIHQINLPAVGYNFNDKDPVGWVEALLTAQGGDFILHATAGNKDKDGTITKLVWRT